MITGKKDGCDGLYSGTDEEVSMRLQKIFVQLLSAIAYSHENDVMHQDVKPDNILIDSTGQLKIGDLGHARMQHDWDDNEGDARYLAWRS